MGESYSCDSGGRISAGCYTMPMWRRNLPVRTWANEIGANTVSALDPKNDPAANPLYPLKPPWQYTTNGTPTSGQSVVMDAWCGGAFGEATGNFWVFGGGHTDYGGNEVYVANMYADVPTWERINNPTTDMSVSPVHYFLHPDGQTRTVHSYNNLFEKDGALYCTGGSIYDAGGGAVYVAHISRNDPVWRPDYLNSGDPYFLNSWGVSCYNPEDNAIYKSPAGGYANCKRIDLTTGVVTQLFGMGNVGTTGYYSSHWNTKRNVMVFIPGWGLRVWSAATNASFAWTLPAGPPVTGPASSALVGTAGFCYDTVRDVYYLWGGGSDHGTVVKLTPPPVGQNPQTSEWTTEFMVNTGTPPTFSISGALLPNAAKNGTYGRLFYSARLDAIGVVSRVTDKISILPLS